MTKLRLFLLSLMLTIGGFTVYFYLHRPEATAPELVRIGDGTFITSQLHSKEFRLLRRQGIKSVVDIRPDGEAADQLPSSTIESLSKVYGMTFHYVPVPHESIPDDAVAKVGDALAHEPKPILLYCRTGRRAVRTFALAQASQSDGPNEDAICTMVKTAGFSADDLKANIEERISHRNNSPVATNP